VRVDYCRVLFLISHTTLIYRALSYQEDFTIRTLPLKNFEFFFGFLYFYAFRSVEHVSEMLILLKPCLSVAVASNVDAQ
jgi:hypothetical protein